MASIEEQGKLTDDLKNKIQAAETLVVVRGFIPPLPSEEKDESECCKGKGAGRTWPI